MNKKKLFALIFAAVITASAMLSCKNFSENHITDAFLKNNGSEYVCIVTFR